MKYTECDGLPSLFTLLDAIYFSTSGTIDLSSIKKKDENSLSEIVSVVWYSIIGNVKVWTVSICGDDFDSSLDKAMNIELL